MGGAAGEWLIIENFSTDLDEMGIFVLSKDHTFRICAILVIHLSKWCYFCIITSKKPFKVSLINDDTENLYVIEIYFVFFIIFSLI